MLGSLQQELAQRGEQPQSQQQQQQHRLQQGAEPPPGAAARLGGDKLWAAEAAHARLQQAGDAGGPTADGDAAPSGSTGSISSESEAGGRYWQSAEEQGQEGQVPPWDQSGSSAGSEGEGAAFQFALQGQQQRPAGHQAADAGSSPAGSPRAERQEQRREADQPPWGGFAGFGSPIRVQPSPAKPAGPAPSRLRFAAVEGGSEPAADLDGGPSAGNAHLRARQQPPQDGQQRLALHTGGDAEQDAVSFGYSRDVAAEEQATPALGVGTWPPAPPGPDPYLTARSVVAPASCAGSVTSDAFDSPRSDAAGSEGASSGSGCAGTSGGTVGSGGGHRIAVPAALGTLRRADVAPVLASATTTPPLLGAGRKDLDSIVGSIRRLAAEMR